MEINWNYLYRIPVAISKSRFFVYFMAMSILLPYEASAQQPANEDEIIEQVIITGSRIPRAGFETLQPATVLLSDEIDLRGSISLAKILNEQSGFITPATTSVGEQFFASTGQNFVDFLGLGEQRTLTLVNSQRFPSGAAANGAGGLSVDLNAIPENLIDRVETIAIGGAPIYGSDAIAGTVNIILKDDYEGLDIVASGGQSDEYNDAQETRLGVTFGRNIDNGRGNITFSLQTTSIDGLKQTDRPITARGTGFEAPGDPDSPYAQEIFHGLKVAVDNNAPYPLYSGDEFGFNLFGNGIPLDINDPDSPLSQFDAQGNLLSFVPGGGTGTPIFQAGGDGLDLAPLTALNTDTERYNFTVLGNYELTESVRFKSELWFARTDATQVVNQPGYNSPAFGGLPADGYGNVGEGPIPVLIDNPFLPEATRSSIATALNIVQDLDGDGLADPSIDTDGDGVADAVGFWRGGPLTNIVGDAPNSARRDTYRAVFGLEGDLDIGNRDYQWDIAYTYGRTESADKIREIIQPNFDQAVQVVIDAEGNPACADSSGGCAPLNTIGVASPEAIAFVSASVTNEIVIEQRVFSANIAGDIFDLPAGSIGGAAGFAFRDEKSKFTPNLLALKGLTRNELTAISGEFDSTEFYGETVVPLLGGELDTPWVESLEFEGAIRFVDNSVAGEDTTWTAGLRYRPVDDLEIRGNLTESIRAPSITELFTPSSVLFDFADDPCDARFIDQGNVPSVRAANCASAGLVQPFTSFIVNASQPGTLSGNTKLASEIAESTTFGVVVRPRFLPGFTAAVDWFDIEIENAIESLTVQDMLLACYDSANFAGEAVCGNIQRDAAGQIADFQSGFVNLGLVEFTGIQSVISYDTGLGRYGDLSVGLNHLYTDKHTEVPGSGNTVDLAGLIGRSEQRLNLNATWRLGDWTWFNQLRWLDSAVFDNSDGEFSRNISGVDDWTVVNTTVGYALNDNIDLQLTIDNLFDKDPPFPAVAFGVGIAAYYPGVIGRFATFTVRATFE